MWVVFLSQGSLGNEAVSEHKVSWGKCKIGALFLRGPSGPEGVGSLGSMCSLELLNPAGNGTISGTIKQLREVFWGDRGSP